MASPITYEQSRAYWLLTDLGPRLAPALEEVFERRDLCILATRIAVEVALYFGIELRPQPVRAVLYNAAFARHQQNGFRDLDIEHPETWTDGSWSVGIGYPGPGPGPGWNGHLIGVTDTLFADYSINQGERRERGIITGPALIGPRQERAWSAVHSITGTHVLYECIEDNRWRRAPDWNRNPKRLRSTVIAKLIRDLRTRY